MKYDEWCWINVQVSTLDIAVVVDVQVQHEGRFAAELDEALKGELALLLPVRTFQNTQVDRSEEDLELYLEVIFDRAEQIEHHPKSKTENRKIVTLRILQQMLAEVAFRMSGRGRQLRQLGVIQVVVGLKGQV